MKAHKAPARESVETRMLHGQKQVAESAALCEAPAWPQTRSTGVTSPVAQGVPLICLLGHSHQEALHPRQAYSQSSASVPPKRKEITAQAQGRLGRDKGCLQLHSEAHPPGQRHSPSLLHVCAKTQGHNTPSLQQEAGMVDFGTNRMDQNQLSLR